jgi:HAD hydrolase, family IA, variant 1
VKFAGGGVTGLTKNILEKEKYDIDKELFSKTIRKYYDIYFDYKVEPYKEIPKILDFLEKNKIKKGIITNKDHNTALSVAKEKLKKWEFCEIIGSDEKNYPNKPNPYNVDRLSEKFGIPKEKILFVGDMLVDVNTAKNAKVDIAYCKWGFGVIKGEMGIDESCKIELAEDIIKKIKGE